MSALRSPSVVFSWASSDSVAVATNQHGLQQGQVRIASSSSFSSSTSSSAASSSSAALVAESHGVFASLDAHAAAAAEARDDGALRTALIRASTHYRALLVASLQQQSPDGRSPEDLAALRVAHVVWHAAELFCLGPVVAPTAAGAPLLLQWLVANHSDDDADARDVDALLALPAAAERDARFWPLVQRLAIRGRAQDAAALLSLHSAVRQQQQQQQQQRSGEDDAVLHVRELLLRLPLASAATHSGDVAFLQAWRAWQRDCASLRQASAALRAEAGTPVARLFAIMCGDLDVIERAFAAYERLGAILTFVEPCASVADVARHARRVLPADDHSLDAAILMLLHGDAYNALAYVEQHVPQLPAGWLDAHLTDLLWRAGVLESYELQQQQQQLGAAPAAVGSDTATRLREARLLRYVDALAASEAVATSLDWALLCTYWRASGAAGEAHALLRLARANVTSTRDGARLLSACEQFGNAGAALASRVRAALGVAALRRGRAGDAIRWLMASGDAERLNAVATLLLERFAVYAGSSGARFKAHARELSPLDGGDGDTQLRAADVDTVLGLLSESYMYSGKISFLSDYRRLHALWEANELAAYAKLTVELLRVEVAAQRFWATLLLNCLPLLEHERVVFDAAQTRHLLRCLGELETSHRRSEYLGGVHATDLAALRLALTRNLARTLVSSSSSSTNNEKN